MTLATIQIIPTSNDLKEFNYSHNDQESLNWLRIHFNEPRVECGLAILTKPFCGSYLAVVIDGICIPQKWVHLEEIYDSDKSTYMESKLLDEKFKGLTQNLEKLKRIPLGDAVYLYDSI
jgi:hypothetical protein